MSGEQPFFLLGTGEAAGLPGRNGHAQYSLFTHGSVSAVEQRTMCAARSPSEALP
ncbi:hypothetical protein DGo_PF0018 (plasmid) [Deinococcus gobiensis I-0]|uniref:Uncharacterized protein n=1 Tax=Deinococcus gobiensis (strain DSM 21396 / JCM 16679 / CGMCC 1.7299 / I-0) TaxID=745776 RepID=H8H3Z4_DEIGI|nr:hypothetical protein DGo_PF0018 [Deinococcus gobiensis I-0]